MLQISDLRLRIEGRPILDGASAQIPSGHKVGLVGRNGAGKTTLLRLIAGEIAADGGAIVLPKGTRIGYVSQEAPGSADSLVAWVLAADKERSRLLAEAETAADPHRIADIQLRLADIGAHSAPARAAQVLAGLGFGEDAQQRPCRDFSGGWRMRVALAAVLFVEPELLLLDEPTNYLDLEGSLWLESYLAGYPHTVLIVSHDRDLLNRTAGSIAHLDRGRLTLYAGNYDAFEEARRERQRRQLDLRKRQDEERRRMEAFVARFRAKASKAAQAQSRVKALARMQPIAEQVEDRVVPFAFPGPAKRRASPLLALDGVAAGYDPARPVLRGLDLTIAGDDRIALLGQNGNGKSTLARLLAGRLEPLAGSITGANRIEVGYFAQHQLDELDPALRPYDYIVRLMPDASEAERRSRLGGHGFGADKADTECAHLSGGEKARLLLMLAGFHGPHLLILDEPTNHLDVDSREALIHGLNEFDGAVVLISHDRHLIEATADRLWLVRDGRVGPYGGDIDGYRRDLLAERSARRGGRERRDEAVGEARPGRAEQRRAAAERRSELAPLKRHMQSAEVEMERLASEIARLDAALAAPTIYVEEPARAQDLAALRGRLAKQLAAAEEAWLAASEAYESASRDRG